MRLKRMLLGAAALASLAALAAAGANFNIDGVYQPTYVCFDGQGRTIVAEKAGVVKIFDGYFGTGGRVLLDIQNLVANYGDHGLMGSLVYQGFLWLTFSRETPGIGDNCGDTGEINGRELWQINGCILYGRFARAPYDVNTGTITGPLETLMDGEDNNHQACTQFATHGMTGLVVGPDGALYVSHGDGASYQGPDEGQYGTGPRCMDDPAYPGGFRAQNPNKISGKIMRVNPDNPRDLQVYVSGVRNPFRLHTFNGAIYQTDTGWYTWEEVNKHVGPDNSGWPCFEGPEPAPLYAGMNKAPCVALANSGTQHWPWYTYKHPANAVGNVMSISAVGGWGDRIFADECTFA